MWIREVEIYDLNSQKTWRDVWIPKSREYKLAAEGEGNFSIRISTSNHNINLSLPELGWEYSECFQTACQNLVKSYQPWQHFRLMINRFLTEAKFASNCGLIPSTFASGGKICHGGLVPTGNRWLKYVFIEAS